MALTKDQLSEAITLLTGSPATRKQLREHLDRYEESGEQGTGHQPQTGRPPAVQAFADKLNKQLGWDRKPIGGGLSDGAERAAAKIRLPAA